MDEYYSISIVNIMAQVRFCNSDDGEHKPLFCVASCHYQ